MKHFIAPSILSADFNNLQAEIEMLNKSEADWIHCDVMDGRFVPNISFGIPVLEAVKKIAKKPLDVHLMIVEPEKYIAAFQKAGADILTVHYEASTHLHRTIQAIKEAGMQAGVAINPHTPVDLLEEVIGDIDLVCLMSVNPGFGGQKFIKKSLDKIKRLKKIIEKNKATGKIEVDGGVDLSNAFDILNAGGDILVAGNSVFKSQNPSQTINELKEINISAIQTQI